MRYRHVIWDWNGTLFDDAGLCRAIMNDLLRQRGLACIDAARYAQVFTFPVKAYYQAVGFDFSDESFETVAAQFVACYDRERFTCGLQPAARETLAGLTAQGITQSVLSAYEQSRLDEMLQVHGLSGIFTHVNGLCDYYATSKVELGRAFVAKLPCAAEQVLFVGDTPHDAETARAMGVDCVLIPSGHCDRERLRDEGVPILDALPALLRHVAEAGEDGLLTKC